MRLVFAGTPQVAVPALQRLLDSARHEVVAVLTRPDARTGRGRKIRRSPVAELAVEAGVELLQPQRVSDVDFQARLAELAPDCCPVVAYGALIPPKALDLPAQGWVNLHFSLLPAWRGAAPVQAAIRHGDEITGATTFRLVSELDAGPTYGAVTETIHARDTAGDLLERLADSGARLLEATVDGIEDGTVQAYEQPSEGVSYAPKVTTQDALVDFTEPAFAVDRRIRSVTPAPGARTWCDAQQLKLGPVTVLSSLEPGPASGQQSATDIPEEGLEPGQLLVRRKEVLVGTATQPVRLGHVQPFGKQPMPAADWARGLRGQGLNLRFNSSAFIPENSTESSVPENAASEHGTEGQ